MAETQKTKDNHRSEKWDQYLGKYVRVQFKDSHILIGVLGYEDGCYYMQPSEYFSESKKVHRIYRSRQSFRKGVIKQIDLME